MAVGFVLVLTEPTKEHDVCRELLKMPKMKEVCPLFGEYDIIVKIKVKNLQELDERAEVIKKIRGVIDIKILTGIKFSTPKVIRCERMKK